MFSSQLTIYEQLNSPPKTDGDSAPAAPLIRADFLTGNTDTGLERIGTRLLDLTNRDKLLNFRHSVASSIRVVDVSSDSVFVHVREGGKLTLLPVPEPDVNEENEKPTAAEHAERIGWRTSPDLGNATIRPVTADV